MQQMPRTTKYSQTVLWTGAGAGTFWSEPEPLQRSGSGSTLDKTDEILNDILFVSSHIDKRLFKKQINKRNFSS